MRREKIFVYGALKESMIQKDIFGRVVKGEEGRLYGYTTKTISVDGEIYPIAESGEANSYIDGLILDLTQKELQCADVYEGDMYKRVSVLIHNDLVWVYVNPATR